MADPSGLLLRGVLFVFGGVSLAPAAEAQWPQYGGPTRDFRSPETGLLDHWPEEGPRLLWSTPRRGSYASLLVDDGRLISQFAPEDGVEVVVALDALDGSVIWEAVHKARDHARGGGLGGNVRFDFGHGPNATPIVHDSRVVAVGFWGFLRCLDEGRGDVLWSHDLIEEFGAKVHMFGYSISPLTVDDTVVVAVGSEDVGMAAFDWETGEVAWTSESLNVSYASPFLIDVDGHEQMVFMASAEVVGLDPRSGEVLWRFPHHNLNFNNCWTPLFGDDGILTISSHSDGYTQGLQLANVSGKATVAEVWRNDKVRYFHTSSLRLGDVVLGAAGTASPTFLTGIDARTGKMLFKQRGFDKASLLLADDKLYIVHEQGIVSLARLTSDGIEVISSFQPLAETAWAAPTIANGVLYLRDESRVAAYDVRGGAG